MNLVLILRMGFLCGNDPKNDDLDFSSIAFVHGISFIFTVYRVFHFQYLTQDYRIVKFDKIVEKIDIISDHDPS